MKVDISAVLFLIAATGILVSMLLRPKPPILRFSLLEPAVLLVMGAAFAVLGREALMDHHTTTATLLFVAATEIGIAAVVLPLRGLRNRT